MRYLSLFLILPILSAQAAPDCSKVQRIAQKLEADVNTHLLKDCEKVTPALLGQPDNAPGFEDYRCKDYAAVDLQLKSIENEIAMLKGIASLKTEIDRGVDTLKRSPDKSLALNASQLFYKNLKVAASLEELLRTSNKDGNILHKVVTDKNGWTDINSFAGLLKKYCKEYPSEGTVCSGKWSLTPEVFKEIEGFVKLGEKTVSKFEKKQVRELAEALSVKKDGKDYSYGALLSEIKDPGEGVLAKESLAIIKAMPDLEHARNSLNFRMGIKLAATDLKKSEALIAAQSIPDNFKTLVQDLKGREEWQLKSKLSFILNQYDKHLAADARAKCDEARSLSADAGECLDALARSTTLSGTERSRVEDLAYEMKYGINHISKLNDIMTRCVPDADLQTKEDCNGIISKKLEDLIQRSQALSALKAAHIQSAPELITMRNFVMEKLLSGECMTEGNSDIQCDQDLGSISKETLVLSENTGRIIHLLDNPEQDNKIDGICDEGKEMISYKDAICELIDEEPSKKSWKREDYQPQLSPTNTRDKAKEGLVAAGTSMLQSIAGYLSPRPNYMVNPYTQNMNPYPMATGPMDISQKIMTPYMARGYGNYSPTPGLRPYSSVNSNVGAYSAYSFGGSKYFNSPVGW